MANFRPALEAILAHEGGFQLTNTAHDKGGMTYAGISRRGNPHWAGWDLIDRGDTESDVLKLHVESRYRSNYWTPIEGDKLPSQEVALSMFSCAVLSGPSTSVRLAQMVCGVTADGIMGPVTLGRLEHIQSGSPAEELFDARFALARIARYSEIVKRNPTQAKFLRGWINRALRDSK